jgi:regulator of RNase E activity RraA
VGSVDALLEAIDGASGGEVLVVDDGGLDTEACVGDLVVLEAREAGLAGVVVWGRHRDTAQLAGIGLPVFSRGACPAGPRADRQRPAAAGPVRIGHVAVAPGDLVLADDDGVLVVDHDQAGAVIAEAQRIQAVEAGQAQRLTAGISLREQLDFPGYLQRRRTTPSLTFRHHLAALGAAIEA